MGPGGSPVTSKMDVALFLVLSMVLCGGAMAQSGCTNVLIGLAPCLNYVTGSSKTPSSSCCSSLASVVQSQPQCLCTVLNGGASTLGININQTLALALPDACKVQTPPVSQCNAGKGAPAMAPVESFGSPPPESPAESPIISSVTGAGSKTVLENGATSDANGTTMLRRNLAGGIVLLMAFIFRSF